MQKINFFSRSEMTLTTDAGPQLSSDIFSLITIPDFTANQFRAQKQLLWNKQLMLRKVPINSPSQARVTPTLKLIGLITELIPSTAHFC